MTIMDREGFILEVLQQILSDFAPKQITEVE